MNALVRTELFYSKQKGYSKNICVSFFFTSGEIERLKYARFNQDSLRSDVFENLEDAVLAADAKVGNLRAAHYLSKVHHRKIPELSFQVIFQWFKKFLLCLFKFN